MPSGLLLMRFPSRCRKPRLLLLFPLLDAAADAPPFARLRPLKERVMSAEAAKLERREAWTKEAPMSRGRRVNIVSFFFSR